MSDAEKKPYQTPRFTHYGKLGAVTTGVSGPFDDGASGMMTTMQMMGKGKPGPLGGL